VTTQVSDVALVPSSWAMSFSDTAMIVMVKPLANRPARTVTSTHHG